MLGRAVLLGCCVVVVACDPEATMHGHVKRTDGMAVSGADVHLACPEAGDDLRATTTASGEFSAGRVGCIPKACRFDVAIAGEPTRTFPSAGFCADSKCGDDCSELEATLTVPLAGMP